MTKRFLKSITRLYQPARDPAPMWDINLVLLKLMDATFELMSTCFLPFLFLKAAFLLASTLFKRLGELRAAMVDPL